MRLATPAPAADAPGHLCRPDSLRRLVPYAAAAIAVLVSLLIRLALTPWLGEQAPLMAFLLGIGFSAWLGGFGAGMAATALSCLAGTYFLLPPVYSFQIIDRADLVRLALLVFEGAVVSLLFEVLHRSRVRVQQALAGSRATEERYRRLFDDSPSGLCTVSPQGRLILANPALQTMLKYGSADELAASFAGISSGDDWRRFIQLVERNGEARRFEAQWPASDGSPVRVRQNARAIRNAAAGILYYEVSVEDVTEESRLAEQLAQSQKLEAVGRLAGGVAHDFNNLLTIILGYADIVSRKLPAGNPLHSHVDAIRDAGERAARLTGQLLAFSRKHIVQPKVLSLNETLQSVTAMLRRLLGEDIRIDVAVQPETGNLHVDPNQIEQVIMNLAVNARDAMPNGGRLRLATRNFDLDPQQAAMHDLRPGPYVLLSVSDTGVGMDQATKQRIFEPFFTTKPDGKGTGLGLSMVYGIVRQSEGAISVYTEPGHGTTFNIYLPRVDEPATAPSAAAERPLRRGTGTVLVVEDEDALRRLATEILEEAGYKVISAANGDEAIQRAAEYGRPVDLVVADVVMPGMSGPELALKLQAMFPRLQVAFVSGYHDHAALPNGENQTGTKFLQKPYTTESLLNLAGEIVSKTQPTVIVVDDEAGIRDLIRSALEDDGYRVVERDNGANLARVAADENAAAVVIDLVMPDHDGLETIPLVRKTRPDIKVIAVSGAVHGGGYLRAAQILGADAVLQKPFRAEQVVEQMRGLLGGTAPTDSSPSGGAL